MKAIISTLVILLFFSYSKVYSQQTFKKTIKAKNQVNEGMMSLTQDGGFIMSGAIQKNDSTVITIFKIDKDINSQWTKVISNGTHLSDYGWSGYPIVQTSDGGYALTTNYAGGFIFIKLNSSGNILWTKKYTLSNGTFLSPSRLLRTNDNSVTMCGGLFYNGKYYQCLFKINSLNGSEIWMKSWSLNGGLTPQIAQAVNTTKDSGYIVGGNIGTYYTICRFDKNGVMKWNKTYAPAGNSNNIYAITETLDKGYVFTGNTRSSNTIGTDDLAVMKLDTTGKIQWTKQCGNISGEYGFDVVKNEDSSFTIVGFRTVSGSYRSGYLVKLDKAGSLIWSKEMLENQTSGLFATYTSLFKTKDKGYILGGSYTASNKRQMAVLKFDSLGNNCGATISGDTALRSLPVTEQLYTSNNVDLISFVTVSDDSFGNQKNKATISSICASGILSKEASLLLSSSKTLTNAFTINIYPNPVVDNTLNLRIESATEKNMQLSIYNAEGKNVYSEKVYSTSSQLVKTININSLSKGIYFIKLQNGKEQKILSFVKQ